MANDSYMSIYSGEEVDAAIKAIRSITDFNDAEAGLPSFSVRINKLESLVNGTAGLIGQVASLNALMSTCLKTDNVNSTTRPLVINSSKIEEVSTNDNSSTLKQITIDSTNKYLYPAIQIKSPSTMVNQVSLGERALYYIQDSDNSGFTLSIDGSQNNSLAWHYYKDGKPENLARITSVGQVYGAVWNDYAEFRESTAHEPGRVICENGDGSLILSTKRLQACPNVISDTYGFAIGQTDKNQTPVAVSGRVLAYTDKNREKFKVGDCVCSGPNGTISRMNRIEVILFPDRILGVVSEIPDYDYWGMESVPVNNRIWIKIK